VKRRDLTEDDAALWLGVARSIKPLRRSHSSSVKASDGGSRAEAVRPKPVAPGSRAAQVMPRERPEPAPPKTKAVAEPAAIDRRLRQRLARGREPIDARIDLHGLTQNEAHGALLAFLRGAQSKGARLVLIVTGKGRSGDPSGDFGARGVLRRQVPLWLGLPEFRALIVEFGEAHVAHGGQGALYARLRRQR
jgi:DNA-nicking Smr family endonuclease